MARPARRKNSLEPWMIALIVLAVLVVLAIIIGLVVYFLVYDQRLFFYNASFRINNVPYNRGYEKQTSEEFRDLSATIENLINQAFQDTHLSKRFLRSHVIRLRPDNGVVFAEVVLVLRFISSDNKQARLTTVNTILLRRLRSSTWPLNIDISSYSLTEINSQEGEHLLSKCCGTRMDKTERVIGGSIAGEGEWPWQASLQLNGIHRCGATIISEDWLVSAAHCFRGVSDTKSWTSTFGARIRTPAMIRDLQQIIIHEHYANSVISHEYDIAVIKLSPPLQFTSAVHHVCLPEARQNFPENTTCYVTGYGALVDDGPSVGELRQTEVKIISNDRCNRREVYNRAISPGMLCAGYLEGGSDACQGDSGGPLVTSDSRGIWYLVGIVSWGAECARPNKPGVYTRVTYYRDWIFERTGV